LGADPSFRLIPAVALNVQVTPVPVGAQTVLAALVKAGVSKPPLDTV
jgi:16S rRNA C1402 (ribose-2'-O) methylase RsmI